MDHRAQLVLVCLSVLVFVGCVQPYQKIETGSDQAAVVAHLGPPKETYNLPGGGKRLMWPTQPMGSTTIAVDIDASGKVVSSRQVLQENEFYRAEVGKWTHDDVLMNFGRPFETSYFPLMKREVWSYRYQENNIQHMLFHFYFDDQGILRQTQKAPDPARDPSLRGRF
ncbi:hypothetical protein [Paraburkholderia sp. BL10I2N1]|uniref:hypothetical protein n=1 Tax=Paraburkholderia sp. BL10I2N1 TaxID=1938796 RepID=UPI00105B8401|nr:hypothetical protein [Paraburkholderia sp. BL10I2N1]TDN57803.1 hypothetical protein B0G77_8643 [Paraburkholderia sp. BL10I2N1]